MTDIRLGFLLLLWGLGLPIKHFSRAANLGKLKTFILFPRSTFSKRFCCCFFFHCRCCCSRQPCFHFQLTNRSADVDAGRTTVAVTLQHLCLHRPLVAKAASVSGTTGVLRRSSVSGGTAHTPAGQAWLQTALPDVIVILNFKFPFSAPKSRTTVGLN